MIRTKGNRHWVLASLAALTFSAQVFAATPAAPAAAPEAPMLARINAEFPGAKVKVVDTKEVNGVKVHDVQIETPKGQTDAVVTEHGDFLLAALLAKADMLPPDVKEVSEGLFGTAPSNVEAFSVTNYVINVTVGGKKFDVKFDATGRVTDIDSKQEMAFEDPKKQPKASAADEAKIAAMVQERWPGAKIDSVNVSGNSPGFFAAQFEQKGEPGWITIAEDGRTRSYSRKVPANQIPKPIEIAISEMKGAKMNSALRWTYQYWQVGISHNGDELTLKIRPDGDVISVESREAKATQQAAAAKHAAAKK